MEIGFYHGQFSTGDKRPLRKKTKHLRELWLLFTLLIILQETKLQELFSLMQTQTFIMSMYWLS